MGRLWRAMGADYGGLWGMTMEDYGDDTGGLREDDDLNQQEQGAQG